MGGIVALWIVVLVPMWLRRYEGDDAVRTMESFSTAMRALGDDGTSRRVESLDIRAATVRREILLTDRSEGESSVSRRPVPRTYRGSAFSRARARRLAVRRRRRLLGCVASVVVFAASAGLGWTSWWLEIAALLVLLGYLVHLRTEAIRRREVARWRTPSRRPIRTTTADVPNESSAGRRDPAAARIADPFPGIPADVLAPTVSASGTENGSRWQPVPVPLPTYVTKPVATRPTAQAPRADVESGTIDLTNPGEWTERYASGNRRILLDESGDDRESTLVLEDDELDRIIGRRRVVGE